MINNYKHIIWDWNGTLFNDLELCVDIINHLMTAQGLKPLSPDDYRDIFTFPVKEYYIKAGLSFDTHSFEELGIQWMDQYELRRAEGCLFDEAEKVLSAIKNSRVQQSILSAYPYKTLIEIIRSLNLEHYFTHISGLDHIYATSKIETGRELVRKINLPKEDIVLIGDTIHDYEVAEAIGAECILISNGHQSKARLQTCGVPVLDSLSQLIA